MRRLAVALALLAGTPVFAEPPVTLRMAAIAPDGTAWARELKAFARQLEDATGGNVRVKWYLGGIAGDEMAAVDRIRRGQLDGAAGAMFCDQLSPSLRVTRVAGLIRSRKEATHIVNTLRPTVVEEFRQNGFQFLGTAGFGLDLVVSRTPVRSLEDLRKGIWWIRPFDDVLRTQLEAIGVHLVVMPHHEAGPAFDAGKVTGFISPPTSALAFQWFGRAKAYTDVKLASLTACMAVSLKAYDALSQENKRELVTASAHLATRFEMASAEVDKNLLGGIIEKQGLIKVEPSRAFTEPLKNALDAARDKIDPKLLPPALITRGLEILSTFRAAKQ